MHRTSRLTDQELLRRYAASNDQQAFATLVSRYQRMVIGICRRASVNPTDMDDVSQAVFLLLSTKAQSVAWRPCIANWLYATTRHVAAKTHRQKQRRVRREAEVAQRVSVSPMDEMKVRELFTILDEEIEKLPPHYREPIVLAYLEEASRQEVAQRLGLPLLTVKTRLERARQRLARALAQRGVTVGVPSIVLASCTTSLAHSISIKTVLSAIGGSPSHRAAQLAQGVIMSGTGAGFRVTAFAICSLLGLGGVCLMAQPQHSPLHLAGVGPSMPKIEVQEPPDPIPQKSDTVKTSAYSPNGKYLAVSTMQLEKSPDGGVYFSTRFPNPGTNATITLYDTTTWKPLQTLKTEQTTTSLCFSADSETLYSAEMDDKIYAWNVKTGMKAKSLDAKKGKCEKLVLSPNGKMLISGHEVKLEMQLPDKSFLHDQSGNFICFWETATDKLIRTIHYDEAALLPRTITVSPDGNTLAGCYLASQTASANLGFHGVIEWDITTGKELRRYDMPRITKEAFPVASSVAFTPDGKGIVMGGGEAIAGKTGQKVVGRIWLFDRKTGKLDKTLGDERKDIIRELVISSDGSRLYIPAGWPGAATVETAHHFSPEIQCWDTSTWKLNWVHRDVQANSHVHLSVSPHGKRILFAGDHGLKFVDSKDGKARGALLKSSD